MSAITFEQLSKLVYDNIAAQAERDAAQAERDAARAAEWETERKEREAVREAERKEREAVREAERKERKEREAVWEAERKKLDDEIKKEMAEIARQEKEDIKQLRKQFGRLGISFGEQVEAIFVNLGDKFNAYGYSFPKEAEGRVKFLDENRRVMVEVDHLLENGDAMLPVEIKAKLKIRDVNDHIKRLRKIRAYNIKHKDNRKVIGAVGGGVVQQKVREYAIGKGLFVLEQNGSSVGLSGVPADFKPTEWQADEA